MPTQRPPPDALYGRTSCYDRRAAPVTARIRPLRGDPAWPPTASPLRQDPPPLPPRGRPKPGGVGGASAAFQVADAAGGEAGAPTHGPKPSGCWPAPGPGGPGHQPRAPPPPRRARGRRRPAATAAEARRRAVEQRRRTGAIPRLLAVPPLRLVRLFGERTEEAQPGFALTEANAGTIAEIVQRPDGLPPRALHKRLGQRLPVLTGRARAAPARQQTLRDAIAWSHNLLAEPEQAVCRRPAEQRRQLGGTVNGGEPRREAGPYNPVPTRRLRESVGNPWAIHA